MSVQYENLWKPDMGTYCILFLASYFSALHSLYKICSRSHIFGNLSEQFIKFGIILHYWVALLGNDLDYFRSRLKVLANCGGQTYQVFWSLTLFHFWWPQKAHYIYLNTFCEGKNACCFTKHCVTLGPSRPYIYIYISCFYWSSVSTTML